MQADLRINYNILGIFMLLLSFAGFYILTVRMSYYNNFVFGCYIMLFLPIPTLLLKIMLEFKNTYLKYSNQLARTIIYILSLHIFICSNTFILLCMFKFTTSFKIHEAILFIPVFGIVLIISFFWIFLYQGLKSTSEDISLFKMILLNLGITFGIVLFLFFKISFNYFPNINFLHLSIFVSFSILFNITYFLQNILNRNMEIENEKLNKTMFNLDLYNDKFQSNLDQILTVLNVLLMISFLCAPILLGLKIEKKIDSVKSHSIQFISILILKIFIIKTFLKIVKIKKFFEWKKLSNG
jgi:hypothetical protein